MHVLQVINGLGTGGAERSLAESIGPLAQRGVEVSVATLHNRNEGVRSAVEDRTAVHPLPRHPWARLRRLRNIIRDSGIDLIHTTIFEADITGRAASVGMGTPVLTSIVNTSYDPIRLADPNVRRFKLEAARAVDALSGRFLTEHFHAITGVVAQSASQRLWIPPDRITVIPRGRDRSRLGKPSAERRAAVRAQLGLDPEAPVILGVGRQEFQKGHTQLVAAADRLLRSSPDLTVLIAGRKGGASAAIRSAIDATGSPTSFRLVGHVDNVPDLMCAADVLVFPSLFEGLGGTLIEAMGLGLPIVATDLPVIREVVGDAALLASRNDPSALSAATQRVLIDTRLRVRLAAAGQRRFGRDFELERVMDQMAHLMRRVAGCA